MSTRLIYAVNYLMAASIGLVFVFLADLQERNGLETWELGVVAAMGFLAALVAQLLLAPLADRGHISVLATIGVVAGVVGTVGFVFASQTWTLALTRGLVGVGLGLYGVAARKAIIGMDTEGAGAKLGTLLSTGVAGFLTGPPIGAVLGRISFETPFWAVGAVLAAFGLPAILAISKTDIATAPVDYSDLADLIRRPRVQAAVLSQVALFGFIGVFDATVDRYLTDLGATTDATAVALVFIGLPLLVLPTKAGALAERVGGARVLLPSFLVIVPAIVLFGVLGSVVLVSAAGVVETIGESFAFLAIEIILLEVTGAARAAVGHALLEAAGLVSATLTAGLGPLIYGLGGSQVLFIGFAVFSGLLFLSAWMRLRVAYAQEAAVGPPPIHDPHTPHYGTRGPQR